MAQGLLVTSTLLFMLGSPLLALALPLTQGSKLGWFLWALSSLGVMLHWRAYLTTGEIYYTVGDTIEYNAKKPDFAITMAISSWALLSFAAHFMRKFLGILEKTYQQILLAPVILAISIAAYHTTLRVVRDQDWGTGHCLVIPAGKESDMTCGTDRWIYPSDWKGEK